jgi:hypothetical protein
MNSAGAWEPTLILFLEPLAEQGSLRKLSAGRQRGGAMGISLAVLLLWWAQAEWDFCTPVCS